MTEAEVYDAYQKALDIINDEIMATTDKHALASLNAAAQVLSDVLTEENKIHLEANAAAFTKLTPQMKKSNEELKKLKDDMASIAAEISHVAKVLGAINSVLQITSKFL